MFQLSYITLAYQSRDAVTDRINTHTINFPYSGEDVQYRSLTGLYDELADAIDNNQRENDPMVTATIHARDADNRYTAINIHPSNESFTPSREEIAAKLAKEAETPEPANPVYGD